MWAMKVSKNNIANTGGNKVLNDVPIRDNKQVQLVSKQGYT